MSKIINLLHVNNDKDPCMVRNVIMCIIPNKHNKKSATPHDINRLIFVNKGEMQIEFTNGQIVHLQAGSVFIPKNDLLRITTYNCEDYCIYFQNIPENVRKLPIFHLKTDFVIKNESLKNKLIVYFDKLINDFQLREFGYKISLDINFQQILLFLSRLCINSFSSLSSASFAKIKPAIIEMHSNYSQNTPLKHYADICNMSLSSFQHAFSKIMHTTPVKYITNIKLQNSVFLLTESGYNITEISDVLGFSSPAYFSNLFKKVYGVSPVIYREKYK